MLCYAVLCAHCNCIKHSIYMYIRPNFLSFSLSLSNALLFACVYRNLSFFLKIHDSLLVVVNVEVAVNHIISLKLKKNSASLLVSYRVCERLSVFFFYVKWEFILF